MKIMKFISKRLESIKDGFIRFPESVFITVAVVVLMIINVETEINDEIYRNIILTLWVGLLLVTNAKLISERVGNNISRIILDSLSGIFMIGLYIIIPREMTIGFVTFYMSLITALVIAFLVIPYFYRKNRFSFYCLRTGLGVVLTLFYCMVVFAGVSGLIFAVESLFEFDFSDMIYLDMLIISLGLFGVVYFLSTIEDVTNEVSISRYPKGIKIVLTLILIPLMIAYTVIMYAYFVRILITMEWPIGIVGQLVIWYGLAAWISVFLLEGVPSLKKWQQKWLKYHPYVFILPIILMITSVGIRIYHYGVTQLRYYVVLGAIWFIGCTVVSLFYKYKTMVFALLGGILLLVGSFGPLGSVQISFNSQEARIVQLLDENDMLLDGKVVANASLDKDLQDEIMSAILYINELDKLDEMDILPESFDIHNDMAVVFGFQSYYPVRSNTYYHYRIDKFEEIEVKDGVFVPFRLEEGLEYEIGGYQLFIDDDTIVIKDTELTIDLTAIAGKMVEDFGDKYNLSMENLTYTYLIEEQVKLTIVLQSVDIEKDGSGYDITHGEGFIIIEK